MERRRFLRVGAATSALAATSLTPLSGAPVGAAIGIRRRGRPDPGGLVRLSSNENPLGISDRARRAIVDALVDANRYQGMREPILAGLAGQHGVATSGIVLGNGSTEAIQMAVQAFWTPETTLVLAAPTYEDAGAYADALGTPQVAVPLLRDHQHDLEGMERAARRAGGPVLFYVCNPNNPTGTLTSCDDLAGVIDRAPASWTFLLDEAYYEFAEGAPGYRSFERVAHERPNVIVFRTFSKVFGLAGLRIGYALAHPDTARRIARFASVVNLNLLAQVAAAASMEDPEHVIRTLDEARRARRVTESTLDRLGVERLPSHGNFLMHAVRGDLRGYIDRMAGAGVRVGRPFPPMTGWNRLSFGTVEEMERWAEVFEDFRTRGLA